MNRLYWWRRSPGVGGVLCWWRRPVLNAAAGRPGGVVLVAAYIMYDICHAIYMINITCTLWPPVR